MGVSAQKKFPRSALNQFFWREMVAMFRFLVERVRNLHLVLEIGAMGGNHLLTGKHPQ